MPDKFDVTKEAEVEGMTDADFSVWKSGKQSEVYHRNTRY